MRLFSDRAGATTLRRDAGGARGVALLMVLTAIAVLTAVSIDFAYNTRVDASLAVNSRDELRAHYLARSAMNLGRLVLHFQNQLDGQAGNLQKLGAAAAQLTGGSGLPQGLGQAAAGAMGGAMGGLNIRLWEVLPVDSGAIAMFVGAAGAPPADGAPLPVENPAPGELVPTSGLLSFGTFDGGFHAEIADEEAKLNLNKLNNIASIETIAANQLLAMIGDPRWDFLFEAENSHRERYTRNELLVFLRDWIDEDEVESALDPTSPTSLFAPGFADEEGPYTRYETRYRPKNAPFDSLDEVFLVAGIDDRFMAAFRDRLTVYPDRNTPLNVNTSDPVQQYVNIVLAAQDPNQRQLQDPLTIKGILDELQTLRALGPFMGITVAQFISIVEAAGIPVNPQIKHNAARNDHLGDKSSTFTIRARGQAGDVEKTLTAVVRYDQGLGKLLYYREE